MQASRPFAEFWTQYVLAHRHPVTRRFHFVGPLLAWALLAGEIALREVWLVLAALVVPYAPAWVSALLR